MSDEILMTEQEAYDVLKFALNMSPIYGGAFTPDLVNAKMKDITTNPRAGDKDAIEKALADPKSSEDSLVAYSEYYALTDMIYKRLLNYVGNLLSFDLTYYPLNATKKDLTTAKFRKDKEAVEEFLNKFNYKKEFKRVARVIAEKEIFYSQLRMDGKKFFLQELPARYCKLTGRFENGWMFDFDMNWFIQPAVDINLYSDDFKRMYHEWLTANAEKNKYIPSSGLSARNGVFAFWVQTSPDDGFFAWKMNPDVATKVPYFSPLLIDISMKPLIRNLQRNIYILQAQKVIVGMIPLLKERVGANNADALAIKPETMGKFMSLIKQGLDDAIKIGAAPFEDVEAIDFNTPNNNILEQFTQTTASMSGTNSRLLFGTDKPNALETKLSSEIDEFCTTYLYPYFEDFLNFYVNKLTKNFEFCFKFEGIEHSSSKKDRLETQLKLMDKGIVMKQKLASALGMREKELEMHMMMTDADGFRELMKPVLNTYNISAKDSVGGRPSKDVSDMTESGVATQESGSNIEKGGE